MKPTNHDPETSPVPKPKPAFLPSLFVGVLVLALFLVASSRFPLTLDEGIMNDRASMASLWFVEIAHRVPVIGFLTPFPENPDYGEVPLTLFLSDWGFTSFWTGTTSAEGHPQWPVLLNAFGQAVAPSFLPETTKLRFGMIFYFSLAVAAAFYRLKTDFDGTTAVGGVLSILLLPRVFAHAQIAFWDSPLMSSWLLAWALFPFAMRNDLGAVLFGFASALAFASKFPGWVLFLPLGFWLVCRLAANRRTPENADFDIPYRDLAKRAFIAVFFSLAFFILLNPPLWPDPIGGFQTFVYLNTHRQLLVPTLFLGDVYDLYHSLPWWNTAFWTVVTVPLGLFLLGCLGVGVVIRDEKRRWPGLLILVNFLALCIVRACPGTPPHEGVRLFIAAFPFFGMLAGIGAAAVWKRKPGKPILLAVFAACVFNMFWYAPQWLSFYSLPIGGLPGAVRVGMETTYYWDGLDQEVLDWINVHAGPDERVLFSYAGGDSLNLYRKWNRLRPQVSTILWEHETLDELRENTQGYRYYVFQLRQGWQPARDRQLIEHYKPALVKTIRKGGWGPWDLGSVPVIEIYDLENLEQRNETE